MFSFSHCNAESFLCGKMYASSCVILENRYIRVAFDLTKGICLSEVANRITNRSYLSLPQMRRGRNLFEVKLRNHESIRNTQASTTKFKIKGVKRGVTETGIQEVSFQGLSEDAEFDVNLKIELPPDAIAVVLNLTVRNKRAVRVYGRLVFPWIDVVNIGKPENMVGVLPIESRCVKPLRYAEIGTSLYYPEDPAYYHLLNAMEFADIYDDYLREGLFVMGSEDSVEPYHFILRQGEILADRPLTLDPGDKLTLPPLLIGVHTGDWHSTANYYRCYTAKRYKCPEVPQWFKEAGAIYGFSGGGGGAIYLAFAEETLLQRIENFRNLPQLLNEARQLGTNVIYIWDYWEGTSSGSRPSYWNKGDYFPRTDMGGERAFIEGVAKVHEEGGKIIVYLEPFISFKYSKIGQQHGSDWAMMKIDNSYYRHYPDNWSMCPTHEPWIEHMTNLAKRMVGSYDVDGIYLDSYGMQWNWICHNPKHNHPHTTEAYNSGVLELTKRIRQAIQQIKPKAVLMTESFNELLAQHEDGSLDGTFIWHFNLDSRLTASPVRYTLPWVNVFTNGRTLTQLKQVFAAGLNLALGPDWLKYKNDIRSLVTTRRKYKDALIYGRPEFQPETGNPNVISHFFRGKKSKVVTVVNVGRDFEGEMELQSEQKDTIWQDELTGDVFKAEKSGGRVAVNLPLLRSQLRVLIQQ